MDTYTQDETGQWWCNTKRQRQRVEVYRCEQCGRDFPNRHPQRFCSKACTGISQRGFRGEQRTCAWCGKAFTRDRQTARRVCCSRRCAYDLGNTKRGRSGPANAKWKGGIKSHSLGYVREYVPGRGYLLQHRIVMEQVLGRPLQGKEQVHHKNGIRDDNRPENLELWVKQQPPGARIKEQQHCPTCACFK